MSTNHNRIKVADLETNQPNKILKTNQNGELEFSDVINPQTESYNALDCTSEGKTLDARQGKALKDMMDNDYMKLSENQTFSGVKTATNTTYPQNAGIVINNTSNNSSVKNIVLFSNSGTGLLSDIANGTGVFSQTTSGTAGHFYCNGNGKALYVHSVNSSDRTATIIGNTSNDNVYITNNGSGTNIKSLSTGTGLVFAGNNGTGNTSTISKEGYITAKSIELGTGTTQKPSLVIPNGTLTSTPQNGAIERDENGKLWTTRLGTRYQLLENDGSIISLISNAPQSSSDQYFSVNTTKERTINTLPIGTFHNFIVSKFTYIGNYYTNNGFGATSMKIDILLRITNGVFSNSVWGGSSFKDIVLFTCSGNSSSSINSNIMITGFTNGTVPAENGSQSEINGVQIRTADNSNQMLLRDASFTIVERKTITFADPINSLGTNQNVRFLSYTTASYIEKIR
nr:hypothetical protein [Flavobacterium sp. ASV13]